MNKFSMLLYAAEVCGSLSAFLTLVSALSILGVIIIGGISCGTAVDDQKPLPIRPIVKATMCALAMLLVTVFIPSKETVYAIAASEMGEQALKSPISQKAQRAIESWLDQQIGDDEAGEEAK